MSRLEGKVAIITGAARGMGAAGARQFVAEGAKVLLGDVLDDEGQALADSLGDAAVYQRLDVADAQAWADAVETATSTFGRLDVLVNNAGIFRRCPLVDLDIEEWSTVVAINQTGVFLGMKAVVPSMIEAGGGSIVNISSIDGLIGSSQSLAYVASKFAVRGMTKVAALELGAVGIRVNSVHPGGVATPMVSEALSDDEAAGMFAAMPLGRIGRP
jgi:3alpha(or 20beta)-hydroxysteroid dehydrogenase